MVAAVSYTDVEPLDEDDEPVGDGEVWCPEPQPILDLDSPFEARQRLGKIPPILPSQFTEFAFRMPNPDSSEEDPRQYLPFSFEGRRHMLRPYNTPARRVLLFCARQVEKSLPLSALVSVEDGSLRAAGDIIVGDRLCTLKEANDVDMTSGEVVWASRRYFKACVRVRSRQGHEVEVATTHPMRKFGEWVEAGSLVIGDRIGVVRRAGSFFDECMPVERIRLTAYMIGDGEVSQPNYRFSSLPGAKLDEFLADIARIGGTARVGVTKSRAMDVALHTNCALYEWFREDGLAGKRSGAKFIPPWVFRLSRKDTALFLNRLWSTDGHVKKNGPSKYSIEYCSISKRLIQDVQALLWKFGIPSKIRENWPVIYKRRGEKKLAYILRVETQAGIRAFLSDVGALGKSENIGVPTSAGNNNRDTYPLEINDLIRRIIASNPRPRSGRAAKVGSLRSAGLRETLKYPLTRDKLAVYFDFFVEDDAYDLGLVQQLGAHLHSDLYWDEIVSIEDIGEQECVDFEVDTHHNFVANGFITHNSTLLGNKAITYCCMVDGFRILYVSPSATQTKTFSADRIRDPLETSEVLKAFTTTALQQNVFEKQFINRSKITLRYAFLNADRTRGIPGWALMLDELQDILGDNIPIIEQCLSHAPERWKRYIYAGTPKSTDNILEYYRANLSTQGEWVVPCDAHGGDTGRYWNVLGEKNIGLHSLVCEKCGKAIDPQSTDSQWANMVRTAPFESYRIPQLMVPWRSWDEILLDYKRYSRDKFYNEVLGISFDSGLRPLTPAQIQECCHPKVTMDPDMLDRYKPLAFGHPVYAGLDWGGGEHSYTVLSLGMYIGTKFRIFYVHRFDGEDTDPELQLKKIITTLRDFNVRLIGCDYGGGLYPNDRLVREFGTQRVQKYQYVGKSKKKVFWHPNHRRWMVNRTELMSDVFNAIKRKQLEFPRWEEFHEPYGQDMLNIFSEYNNALRMIQFSHGVDRPDDTFHSILYCLAVSMIMQPRPDIIAPNREDATRGPIFSSYSGPTYQG